MVLSTEPCAVHGGSIHSGSTSWTPDEDFGQLLDAADLKSKKWHIQKNQRLEADWSYRSVQALPAFNEKLVQAESESVKTSCTYLPTYLPTYMPTCAGR